MERTEVFDEKTIRQLVRRVVYRTLGMPQNPRSVPTRPLVTELDVRAVPVGGQLSIPHDALITPLAWQVVMERRVTLERAGAASASSPASGPLSDPTPTGQKTVAIGADHGGYELKEALKGYLSELGYGVVDCGEPTAPPRWTIRTSPTRWRAWWPKARFGAVLSWMALASARVWPPTRYLACALAYATIRQPPSTAASTTTPTC